MEIRGIKEEVKIECPKVNEGKDKKAKKGKFNGFLSMLSGVTIMQFLTNHNLFIKETLAAEIDGGMTYEIPRDMPHDIVGGMTYTKDVISPVFIILRNISLITGILSFIMVVASFINLIIRIMKKDRKNNKTIVVSIVLLVISIVLLILSIIGVIVGVRFGYRQVVYH